MIEVNNLTIGYPGRPPVINDLCFTVKKGEHTALIGSNGAGKSTLLRALVGLLPCQGLVRIIGLDLKRRNLRKIRSRTGFLFQDPQVQLFCPTVLMDVAYGPLNQHGDRELASEQAINALEAVGFTGDLYQACHQLSLGEMRKVALAGILACQPSILLLDEPDSYLDQEGRRKIVETLNSLESITIILATHDQDFAKQTTKRQILI